MSHIAITECLNVLYIKCKQEVELCAEEVVSVHVRVTSIGVEV